MLPVGVPKGILHKTRQVSARGRLRVQGDEHASRHIGSAALSPARNMYAQSVQPWVVGAMEMRAGLARKVACARRMRVGNVMMAVLGDARA